MKRVLVTGPVERITAWCAAAQDAGWDPIELPLVAIVQRELDAEELFEPNTRFGWLVLTSRNALPFVEHALASFPALASRGAAVGEATTERLAELGLDVLPPSRSGAELLARILELARPGSSVLWPHGDRADDLAGKLVVGGLQVQAPVVYETRSLSDADVPASEAVFFASPSAVRSWSEAVARQELESRERLAIAIGETTFEALTGGPGAGFASIVQLSEPTPEAFRLALEHL